MPAVIASPAADAYAIFQRTRSAVSAMRTNHYVASCGDGGSILVSSISQEEVANPSTPRGTDFSIHFYLAGGRGSGTSDTSISVGRPASSADVLGVPILTPTYMFGLRLLQRSPEAPASALAPSFPTIGGRLEQRRVRDWLRSAMNFELRADPARR